MYYVDNNNLVRLFCYRKLYIKNVVPIVILKKKRKSINNKTLDDVNPILSKCSILLQRENRSSNHNFTLYSSHIFRIRILIVINPKFSLQKIKIC